MEREEPRARNTLGLLPLDSASSVETDDSEQALNLFPNRDSFSYCHDFGGRQLEAPLTVCPKLIREFAPGY